MAPTATATIAREYLRVSVDASGRERSPEEQHQDNERAASRYGWTLGRPYRDVGSASRYARRVREDYARLVADLESGRFGASVLILWESSRGSRRLSEWVRLIELCEERGVLIYVTSDGKLYDPANPRDRRSLQEDGVDAEWESAKVSKRVARAAAANASAGRPNGVVPYGYRRVYDPATGKLVGQEIEPAEAAVVREIYQRINAGHSLRSIEIDLARRGIMKRSGKPWTAQHIRTMVLRRLYIGERVHDPARNGRVLETPAATITRAIWPPIVDRSLWLAVRARLTDPTRTTTRPGRGVHLLSGLARCDVCGHSMAVRTYHNRNGELQYVCHGRNCVRLPYDDLNRYAEQVIVAYLSADENVNRLTAEPVDPEAAEQARAEVLAIQRELDELAAELARGGITPALAGRAEQGILARLKEAEQRRDELTRPSALHGLLTRPKRVSVAKWWAEAPMSTKREIVRLLFSPDLLGEMRIMRASSRGHRSPVEERVVFRRECDRKES